MIEEPRAETDVIFFIKSNTTASSKLIKQECSNFDRIWQLPHLVGRNRDQVLRELLGRLKRQIPCFQMVVLLKV